MRMGALRLLILLAVLAAPYLKAEAGKRIFCHGILHAAVGEMRIDLCGIELGVTEIVPFVSSFCVKRPHEDKWQKQSARLARIAEEAAKQCKRGLIPTVAPLLDYEEMLARASAAELPLFCYEGEGTEPLPACLPPAPPHSVSVVIGSEGGFSEKEAEAARERGMRLCGLGKRILRCETAPLFALSALSFQYEI